MLEKTSSNFVSLLETRLPFLTAMFIPLYPMLYLYNKEGNSQYLSLIQVLFVSLIFMLGSMLLFLISSRIFKSSHAAYLFCIVVWIGFFSYKQLYAALFSVTGRGRNLYLIFTYIVLYILLGALVYIISKIYNFKVISLFTGILLFILLLMNVGTIVYNFSLRSQNENVVYKTSFVVDDTLATPNVYWIHCDGMLGFYSMEKYFGDPQDWFTEGLETRGFVINRDAQFDGRRTTLAALPTLMNPTYYDNWLSNVPASTDFSLIAYSLTAARQKSELLLAFNTKYKTATIASLGSYFYPITDVFYNIDQAERPLMVSAAGKESIVSSFTNAVNLTTLLQTVSAVGIISDTDTYIKHNIYPLIFEQDQINSIVDTNYILGSDKLDPSYDTLVRSLDNALTIEEPRFMLVSFNLAHFPFIYDENGQIHENEIPNDPREYPAQHRYTSKVLINLVDMILERDPDAVIVLQADHGLHWQSTGNIMKYLHVSADAAPDIWNGVMSAVRIPEKYGTLEEPLYPLDIARYLVNNYVGQNYEYLQ